MTYQVGRLSFPDKDDAIITDYDEAIEEAIDNSVDDSIWAVWAKESGDLEAIIYQSEAFEK